MIWDLLKVLEKKEKKKEGGIEGERENKNK